MDRKRTGFNFQPSSESLNPTGRISHFERKRKHVVEGFGRKNNVNFMAGRRGLPNHFMTFLSLKNGGEAIFLFRGIVTSVQRRGRKKRKAQSRTLLLHKRDLFFDLNHFFCSHQSFPRLQAILKKHPEKLMRSREFLCPTVCETVRELKNFHSGCRDSHRRYVSRKDNASLIKMAIYWQRDQKDKSSFYFSHAPTVQAAGQLLDWPCSTNHLPPLQNS